MWHAAPPKQTKLIHTYSMPTSIGLPWLSLGPLVSGVASCGDVSRIVVLSMSSRYIHIHTYMKTTYKNVEDMATILSRNIIHFVLG